MPRGRPRKDQPSANGGPPRPYRTPQELKKKMAEYFQYCQDEMGGVFPDEAGMRIFLDIGHASYRSYLDDPEYERVFDWAQDMRECWASRRLADDPRSAQAYLNILKQPSNGGWVDRRTDTGTKELEIKVAGVGGVDAFK